MLIGEAAMMAKSIYIAPRTDKNFMILNVYSFQTKAVLEGFEELEK